MTDHATVRLKAGTLRLQVEAAEVGLHDLCGFASRRSRKRGFVFVSKVLGKHHPVRPRVMAEMHERLAGKIAGVPGPAAVIALAETATGLGQGIYEALLRRTGREDVLFLHTTRYHLLRPLALGFEESHSHASEHLVYTPDDGRLFQEARTLVLVDDEISTGRTLANLAAAYRSVNPSVSAVHLVCLTDWLGPDGRADLARRVGLPTQLHSLLRGRFTFEDDPGFDPGPIPAVTGRGDAKDGLIPADSARVGVRGLLTPDLDGLIRAAGVRSGERVLVLGSGEFAYPPSLLARRLEERGWDVHFQATTRSPLLVDGDITSSCEFRDNYDDDIPNYLYNATPGAYARVLIGYETRPLPANHTLPDSLAATPLFF